MLVLSRKRNETVTLRDEDGTHICTVMLLDIRGDKVRLGFESPDEVIINRGEVWDDIDAELAADQAV